MNAKFDLWLDAYNTARNNRPTLTIHELKSAFLDGLSPLGIARSNDELASEYDEILAAELAGYAAIR